MSKQGSNIYKYLKDAVIMKEEIFKVKHRDVIRKNGVKLSKVKI